MDDAVTVEVFNRRADLIYIALDFNFMKALSATKQLIERLVLAELEQNVDVLCILEEMLEADDVVVMETAVDLDLTHELLLCARLSEGSLRDDLGGRDSLSL